MVKRSLDHCFSILAMIEEYPYVNRRAEHAYADVIKLIRIVLSSALYADVFAVAKMPWPKSATKKSVLKASKGEKVLLEEVLIEIGSSITDLLLKCGHKEEEIEDMKIRIW
jgi:hypothetical protein